jgi:hypothetical protein
VHIDGKEFVFNFFMILPDGYDMMLGINWLRTLGPIVWDFERGHMVFWRGNWGTIALGHQRSRQY